MTLSVSLSPEGQIIASLVGPTGATHSVKLRPGQVEQTLLMLLQNEANKPKLGIKGAPTQAQLDHEDKHSIFPDPRCPFCRQAGKFDRAEAHQPKYSMVVQSGDVTIRRLAPKGKAAKPQKRALTLEDLGL